MRLLTRPVQLLLFEAARAITRRATYVLEFCARSACACEPEKWEGLDFQVD